MKKEYKTYGANAYWTKHETTGKRMQRYLRNMPRKHLNPPRKRFDVKYRVIAALACIFLWAGIIALAVKSI